jgi:hypothetical protein
MTAKINSIKYSRLLLAALLLMVTILSTNVLMVGAAGLTGTSIRFTRMKAATASTMRLTFTVPSGNTGTEAKVKLGFPDSYTIATTSLTASVASCGATSLPGTLTVAGDNTNGSKNITISGVTNLSASTSYCVDIDRTATNDPITNPAAGQYTITVETLTSGDVRIDNTNISARVISDDQVVVSATVPPSFNFVLDANTTSFTSNLDTASVVQTTARNYHDKCDARLDCLGARQQYRAYLSRRRVYDCFDDSRNGSNLDRWNGGLCDWRRRHRCRRRWHADCSGGLCRYCCQRQRQWT